MAFYSSLADVSLENFNHNNMVPFFGSGIKQNMNENMNQTLLEKYTGEDHSTRIAKTEQVNFADIQRNAYTHENNQGYLAEYDRMEVPKSMNNVSPTEQVRVGPGTKRDDLVLGSGGFQQDTYRDFGIYKSIDDLRVKTNPKTTYEGRVVEGQMGAKRGKVGAVARHRPPTSFEMGEDRLLKTTGARVKDKQRPCVDVRDTNRQGCATEVRGNAYSANQGDVKRSAVRVSEKPCLQSYGDRNANTAQRGVGERFDYGRTNILVYNNERDITSTKTYEGNVTSYIKSMVAPVMDALRPTNKEYLVQNAREFGQFQRTAPEKQTVHNPNDPLRTTVKETLIHDTRTGNLKSFEQITTYDPNDVARTTVKETLIHDTRTGNLKSATKSIVYDPKMIAKATGRETLKEGDKTVNLKGHARHTILNTNDVAKTTVKETTLENGGLGIVSGQDKGGGYQTNKHDAKYTNKEIMSNNQYVAHPQNENGDGYKTASFEAKATNKQVTSNKEYYGTAGNEQPSMMSYDDIYNAVINQTRESLLCNQEPTQTGVKVVSGVDTLNLTNVKVPCNRSDGGVGIEKVYQMPPSKETVHLTNDTGRTYVRNENNERMDPNLLRAFVDNPYTHSLTNAV